MANIIKLGAHVPNDQKKKPKIFQGHRSNLHRLLYIHKTRGKNNANKANLIHIINIHRHMVYGGMVRVFCVNICYLSFHASALCGKNKERTRIIKPHTYVPMVRGRCLFFLRIKSQGHTFQDNHKGKAGLIRLGSNLVYNVPCNVARYILKSNNDVY